MEAAVRTIERILYYLSTINLKSKNQLRLRVIAISGECMTQRAAEMIRKTFPEAEIYNVYGLTEASPKALFLPPNEFDKRPLSVGIPLDSVEAKIANNELLLKGKNIMKVYYNDPKATFDSIRDGWLHTGDLL